MNFVKLLFSRRWWWATILVMVAVGVMVRLAFWQIDRLGQRREANAELRIALEAAPQPLPDLLAATLDPLTLVDREVSLTGRFDYEQQVVLLVQNWNGRAGVHLLTPLLLDGGETAVLVDRGWIPEGERANLAQFNQPVASVTLTGYVAAPELLRGNSVIPDAPQAEWYRVDVPAIANQLPYPLAPVYVKQAPADNSALPYRAEREIDLSEGSHLSYTVQWFAFSLMLGVGYLFFVRRNSAKEETAVG